MNIKRETQLRLNELYDLRDQEPTRFKKDRLDSELEYLQAIWAMTQKLKTLEAIQNKLIGE